MPAFLLAWLPVGVLWWSLLCALQDWRWRRVSNWLTVPPFLAAGPLAFWLGGTERLFLYAAVTLCVYLIWTAGGLGAADGKLAACVAAVEPGALVLGLGALWVMYGATRLRPRARVPGRVSLPGAVGLYIGLLAAQGGTLVGAWTTSLTVGSP